jgi:predicted CxxxxCH...CXXCH cytochrome family protein
MHGGIGCGKCHNPHKPEGNLSLIRAKYRHDNANASVVFQARPADFVRQGQPDRFGACENCHRNTEYYRKDGSQPDNHCKDHVDNNGTTCQATQDEACTTCHAHDKGFAAGGCDSCHGYPPATASHATHYGFDVGTGDGYGSTKVTADYAGQIGSPNVYVFGCGNCHSTDMGLHRNGTVDIVLNDPGAPAGSLKARNPVNAAYTPGGTVYHDDRGLPYTLGTCSNVYCHSSGQANPTYVNATWGTPSAEYRCARCHGAPPNYTNGGIGSGQENNHYTLNDPWYGEAGHLNSIHSYTHDGSITRDVINCATCHFETITRYDNTTFPDILSYAEGGYYACDYCHTASTVPPINNPAELASTFAHVNGDRDVVFDPGPVRTLLSLSSVPPLWTRHPASGSTPQYDESSAMALATYDPVTKSCSVIPCHTAPMFSYSCTTDAQCVAAGEGDKCVEGRCIDSVSRWGNDLSVGCYQCHSVH